MLQLSRAKPDNPASNIYNRKKTAGSCPERVARSGSRLDNMRGAVGVMNSELSRPDLLATVQSGRKQA